MQVKLVAITNIAESMKDSLPSELHNPEGLIAYCARVSNPQGQENPSYEKLLKYCIDHKHWSIFEQAGFSVEVKTSRAISAQILRHKSLNIQEFSQRYSTVTSFETYEARRQDNKNRQNSLDDLDESTKIWFLNAQAAVQIFAEARYNEALALGVAKEQSRMLLPMSASTTLYLSNTVRSWIHYLQVRTDPSTQKEHRDIALAIKDVFTQNFPITSKALGWL